MSIEQKIQKNIPLAPLTTFRIGGMAKFFIEARDKDELSEAVEWAHEKKEKIFILAGGSNILINDNGIDGLVIKISNKELKAADEQIECGAGLELAKAVKIADDNGLTGLEWAAGIPGTIGGAVRGNAGAFGSSIGDSVKEVEIFDSVKMEFGKLDNKACVFDYRESIFKKDNGLKIIWRVCLSLKTGSRKKIKEKMREYVKRRAGSQPKAASAGSFFKNLTFADLREFNAKLAGAAEEEGKVKKGMVGAGWIIEKIGLKGKTIGGAKISDEHANFIINAGEATAGDVIMLASYIKQQARDKLGVQLKEEIRYMGF